MSGSTVVFLGRVLVDSGEGRGTGPARVRIEEALFNVPKELREVEINTSAGTSCYYRLKAGERYVVFAERETGAPVRLSIHACSNTFLLQGKEHILDALRNQSYDGPPRLVGSVLRSTGAYSHEDGVPGAVIVARSATAQYTAFSDAFGRYEIRGMVPSRYQLEVAKAGFVPDAKYNRRWSGQMVLNQATNTIEPDDSEPPGSVLIGETSCQVWDLSMWPRGQISGTVTGVTGGPLSGVTVQVFAFDRKGDRESSPLRTGKTDAAGKYLIEPLPGGEYIVGVNAEEYRDAEPYPPTFFVSSNGESIPAPVHVTDGAHTGSVDLMLPDKRIGAILRVQVMAPNGMPYAGATVKLENLAGVQRWWSNKKTSSDGVVEVPVYLGEQYIVSAFDSVDRGNSYDDLEGSSRLHVTTEHPTVVLVLGLRRNADQP
jgi:hypothetical protein